MVFKTQFYSPGYETTPNVLQNGMPRVASSSALVSNDRQLLSTISHVFSRTSTAEILAGLLREN